MTEHKAIKLLTKSKMWEELFSSPGQSSEGIIRHGRELQTKDGRSAGVWAGRDFLSVTCLARRKTKSGEVVRLDDDFQYRYFRRLRRPTI